MVLTTDELIARARRGDEAAWETLVRQHQEGVFRLAFLYLDDAADAEDVAQETFLRAFRSFSRFDPARPLRPWLLSIAANLAKNRRRSLGRYWAALRRAALRDPESVLGGEPPAARRADPIAWEARRLRQAVQGLAPMDREVIYLRFFLELSVAETAQALEIAPGTVKSRLHRALERLKGMLERDFPSLLERMDG